MLKNSIYYSLYYSLILGILYPALITIVGQVFLHDKANGSIITINGNSVGSALIGQNFASEKYFWGRPSAIEYNPLSSSGSNLALSNPSFLESTVSNLNKYKSTNNKKIPVDLVTKSGSGLDPEISLASANYQVQRIAEHRSLTEQQIYSLIEKNKTHDLFGEPRINVLKLNIEMDKL